MYVQRRPDCFSGLVIADFSLAGLLAFYVHLAGADIKKNGATLTDENVENNESKMMLARRTLPLTFHVNDGNGFSKEETDALTNELSRERFGVCGHETSPRGSEAHSGRRASTKKTLFSGRFSGLSRDDAADRGLEPISPITEQERRSSSRRLFASFSSRFSSSSASSRDENEDGRSDAGNASKRDGQEITSPDALVDDRARPESSPPMSPRASTFFKKFPELEVQEVHKSKEEWRSELPAMSYATLRRRYFELPFRGEYYEFLLGKGQFGIFQCAGCGNPLFDAAGMGQSYAGYPCFDEAFEHAMNAEVAKCKAQIRVEYTCARCHGLIGRNSAHGIDVASPSVRFQELPRSQYDRLIRGIKLRGRIYGKGLS